MWLKFPKQGAGVRSLVRELDSTCYTQRSCVLQLRSGTDKNKRESKEKQCWREWVWTQNPHGAWGQHALATSKGVSSELWWDSKGGLTGWFFRKEGGRMVWKQHWGAKMTLTFPPLRPEVWELESEQNFTGGRKLTASQGAFSEPLTQFSISHFHII